MNLDYIYIYTPNKLIQTRKEFNERYKGKTGLIHQSEFSKQRFEELIEEIRGQETKNLAFFSRWLTERDIFLLANGFNAINDEIIKRKVLQVFNICGSEKVIKQLFSNFLRNWHDALLKNFLKELLNKQVYDFPPAIWAEILKENNIEEYIGYEISHKSQPITESLRELGLDGNLELVQECKYWTYLKANSSFFRVQESEQLREDFSHLSLERLKKVVDNYLKVMDQNNFHNNLMVFILKSLGIPNETNTNWNGISETAKEKFRNWFYRSELEKFFRLDPATGKERFEFWKKYVNNIKNLKVEENELILIMDFGRYIVVEFGKTGNAAYIYNKNVFIRNFGALDKAINLKNSLLKDQNLVWERVLHQGYWQYRAARLMDTVLAEGV